MPDPVPTKLLQPVLDATLQVVRAGAVATPAVEVPPLLRPWLTSPRLRGRAAYQTVRTAVEADDELRARVAVAVDEAAVGRVGWLWLNRPDGWEAEVTAACAPPAPAADPAELRRVQRRLEAAEAARDRAFAERDEAQAAAAARVAEAREARQRADEATGALAGLQEALGAAHADAAAASTAAGEVADGLRAELALALDRLAAAEGEVAALTEALAAERHRRAAAVAHLEHARRTAAGDRQRVAAAVADAAGAAVALGRALGRVSAEVAGEPTGEPTASGAAPAPGAPPSPPSGRGPTPDGTPAVAPSWAPAPAPAPAPSPGARRAPDRRPGSGPPARPRSPVGPPTRRTPVAVPPGMFDDTTEWAELLVRSAGALVLVDGYNVTLASWSGRDLADQRRTLVDALAELHAKTAAEVVVVFDGHPSERMAPPPGRPRDAVRVLFSPAGEDADEVVIELTGSGDARRPVVVVTDDRRVRGEVAARGANVLSVAQLVALLRRWPTARGDGHTPRR